MLKKLLKIASGIFLEIAETLVTALTIFVIIYLFLFQPHQVKGNSMYPSFKDKEYILTNKIVYRFKDIQRGDVVIFASPKNKHYDYIKRVIGLPGESVSVKKGNFYINDSRLNESSYLKDNILTQGNSFISEGQTIIVPQNHYFVAGDNRPHSSDSREWGCISQEDIVGKAWLRYWPPSEFGFIPTIAW